MGNVQSMREKGDLREVESTILIVSPENRLFPSGKEMAQKPWKGSAMDLLAVRPVRAGTQLASKPTKSACLFVTNSRFWDCSVARFGPGARLGLLGRGFDNEAGEFAHLVGG